jgi:hypothetical protein
MPDSPRSPEHQALLDAANAAFDRGDLSAARPAFDALLAQCPDSPRDHYMQGLTCKYLRDWPKSLAHNLRCIALYEAQQEAPGDAPRWNAAIAATALGDWAEARRQWAACGIRIPDGEGPIEADFGVVSVRLNPWGNAETLYARRIDPVRARLLNIPLPESGYRRGDIVLNDGASTGERPWGERWVPVLNALQRLEASEFKTFAAFVDCPADADLQALLAMRVPGIDDVEDWTGDIVHYCLRCSYGAPHRHRSADEREDDGEAWEAQRNIGIAAQSRRSAEKLLHSWAANGAGRRVDALETRSAPLSAPSGNDGLWWRSPDDEDEAEHEDGEDEQHLDDKGEAKDEPPK